MRGIRLLQYLDGWLVLASLEAVARQHVRELLLLCHSLGIVINDEKSNLVPSQSATYLGMTIDTVAAKVFPTLAHVEKFFSVVEQFITVATPPPPPSLGCGRCCWGTCHRWRSWYLTGVFECALSSGI